ncbi:MAG: VOC family protein [Candidatus Diapherotrites archaeon]|nr:VOC family protein [Candidatus Diapherotrites archaeon]
MKSVSKDPLGHVKLSVSDFEKSKEFYKQLFKKLGFEQVSYSERSVGWITKEGFGIWIASAKTLTPNYKFAAPGLHHLCFKAISEEEVNEVYEMIKGKTIVFDPPQRYSDYTDKYYAVFFADPDGMKLEVAYY